MARNVKAIKGDLMLLDGDLILNKKFPNIINEEKTISIQMNNEGVFINSKLIVDELIALSDKHQKSDIKEIDEKVSDKIRNLNVYSYFLKNKNTRKVGLLSQEVAETFPHCVENNNQMLYIDYNAMISLLVKSVKELKDEVEILKTKVNTLENQNH